jgi:hypothetical protein
MNKLSLKNPSHVKAFEAERMISITPGQAFEIALEESKDNEGA